MVSVRDLTKMSDTELVQLYRSYIPGSNHFLISRENLILAIARILANNGTLDQDDVSTINTPGFDRIFIEEDGDYDRALLHLTTDLSLNDVTLIAKLI
jgi:hypothetical protein